MNLENLGEFLENRDNRVKFEQFIEVIKKNEENSSKNKEVFQREEEN